MANKIKFDPANIAENPTLVLMTKSGKRFGKINAKKVVSENNMNDACELSFVVDKVTDGEKDVVWDNIKNFKVVYYKEANMCFEVTVEVKEDLSTTKEVECKQLGQAELSQIMIYDTEINTEDDIDRDDYVAPTTLYNKDDHSISLLHRIMEKAQHYKILHVDETIANIQRTFTFDNTSIKDAFDDIAEEISCLFVYHSGIDEDGNIERAISVYDLNANCLDCGHRDEFTSVCPKCGSTNILEGYGNDTGIFVTADELGSDLELTSNAGSIKNCFKLVAGDDDITAAIRNSNPNGTDYIYYISSETREDMSDALVTKLDEYDALYKSYKNEHSITLDDNLITQYNQIVDKYTPYNNKLEKIDNPVIGYTSLMSANYKTIDLASYLQTSLLPVVEMSSTSADKEKEKLESDYMQTVSVSETKNITVSTANNAVLSMAKCIVDSNYKTTIKQSSLEDLTWSGIFVITNYADDEDTAITGVIQVSIDEDLSGFLNQKIQKILSKEKSETTDIEGLFEKELSEFKEELKKYSLDALSSFYDVCQTCLEVLTEQGVADKDGFSYASEDLYTNLYEPYYNKLGAIEAEQTVRQNEIDIVVGQYDVDNNLIKDGVQSLVEKERDKIQDALNFEKFIGSDLWTEFSLYRREDKYENSNYVADGLTNNGTFDKVAEFMETAEKELYKSAELQHSITAKLKNLLTIERFKPLRDSFELGNFLRVRIDDNVYKLRLLKYKVEYDDLDDLTVNFSDVVNSTNAFADHKSVIDQAKSMASSYDSTKRQASQGSQAKAKMDGWYESGLQVTNTKIIGGADNQTQTWDSHGMTFKQYNPMTDSYDPVQMKIINSTIAITDDNWKTTKTALGKINFINKETGEVETGYGLNGDVICANTISVSKLNAEELSVIQKSIDDAGKTATNYMKLLPGTSESAGLLIASDVDGVLSENVLIGNNNIYFRDGDTILAKYGSNGASIGKSDGLHVDTTTGSIQFWNNLASLSQFTPYYLRLGREDGSNVRIESGIMDDNPRIEIRNNDDILASYTGNAIYLGKNNVDSIIDLSNGLAQIYNRKTNYDLLHETHDNPDRDWDGNVVETNKCFIEADESLTLTSGKKVVVGTAARSDGVDEDGNQIKVVDSSAAISFDLGYYFPDGTLNKYDPNIIISTDCYNETAEDAFGEPVTMGSATIYMLPGYLSLTSSLANSLDPQDTNNKSSEIQLKHGRVIVEGENGMCLADTKLILDSGNEICSLSTDNKQIPLLSLSTSDNTVLGYGGYLNNIGATNIYGQKINLKSKQGVYLGNQEITEYYKEVVTTFSNKVVTSGTVVIVKKFGWCSVRATVTLSAAVSDWTTIIDSATIPAPQHGSSIYQSVVGWSATYQRPTRVRIGASGGLDVRYGGAYELNFNFFYPITTNAVG